MKFHWKFYKTILILMFNVISFLKEGKKTPLNMPFLERLKSFWINFIREALKQRWQVAGYFFQISMKMNVRNTTSYRVYFKFTTPSLIHLIKPNYCYEASLKQLYLKFQQSVGPFYILDRDLKSNFYNKIWSE